MDNIFVEKLNIELEKIYNTTNFKNSSINEELNILFKKFDKSVVPLLETKKEDAEKYYEKRQEYSNKTVDPVNEMEVLTPLQIVAAVAVAVPPTFGVLTVTDAEVLLDEVHTPLVTDAR